MSDMCLTILHFNDLHGHTENAPQIASLIKTVKKENEKKDCYTLVLNGGDLISGTYMSYKFKGEAEFKFLKAIGINAMVIGNHDFDFGEAALKNDISGADFSVLGANIYICEGAQPCKDFALRQTIIKFASLKIAVFGLTREDTLNMSLPQNTSNLRFDNVIETAKKIMGPLVTESDIQIALTHVGVEKDLELANSVPDIDAIIGGHDHVGPEKYCQKVKNIPVCQTPAKGKYLGRIDLKIEGGKVTDAQTTLISVNSSDKDKEVADVLAPFETAAKAEINKVVGKRKKALNKMKLLKEIAGVMKETTGASFAFINNTGIRGSLPAGDITFGKIYELCPFDNNLVAGNILGRDIRSLIKTSVEKVAKRDPDILTFSGITYELKNGSAEPQNIMVDGNPLDDNKTYTAATIDFLAYGQVGYDILKTNLQLTKVSGPLRDAIVDYIKK